MNYKVNPAFKTHESQLTDFILNFDTQGQDFGNQDRNSLKLFSLESMIVNIKSFRIPNIFNQIAYRFFRKSKAQRSFEYANRLTQLGVGTPQPIAYYEFKTALLFKRSFYISEQLECDYTFRDLTRDFSINDYETILRAFTRFTFDLHEKGVHFLDHSPGNTLIKKCTTGYDFFLVDLNRMEFKKLDFETRIKNFARLTTSQNMVAIMSDEYAKCCGKDPETVYKLMWQFTEAFQDNYNRRKRLKKRIKFWKA